VANRDELASHAVHKSATVPLRLMTWNCRVGGFRKKSVHVESLRPDILAVQEVEAFDQASIFNGVSQPTFRDRLADPAFPRRAIGVFSYSDTQIRPVDLAEPLFSFRRYEARHAGRELNVVAVWPWQTKSAKTAYRQAHEGIELHRGWIGQRDTVMLGDFNANANFKGHNWKDLLGLLESLNLVSAYHEYFKEEPGREHQPTHFHLGRQTSPFHLDYCFIPRAWLPYLSVVQVGTYADWGGISDHAPVIVDVTFPQEPQ
jgi:endonuclease/exonuclease/phosphatase family metal-dependent hydrolase